MTLGIEETGRDQELLGPTGLLDLLIHPSQVLGRQTRLLGGGFGRALACWILVGGKQGHGSTGLVGPEL